MNELGAVQQDVLYTRGIFDQADLPTPDPTLESEDDLALVLGLHGSEGVLLLVHAEAEAPDKSKEYHISEHHQILRLASRKKSPKEE
jgi:hypothetical protein